MKWKQTTATPNYDNLYTVLQNKVQLSILENTVTSRISVVRTIWCLIKSTIIILYYKHNNNIYIIF